MYSTRTAITMSISDIMSKLDDYAIYEYYLGNIQVGKLIHSPLRTDDKIPSFGIFKGRAGNLLFKDHGSGESGNALKFVQLYKRINTKDELERELLRILKNKNITCGKILHKQIYESEYKSNATSDIGIVRQPFTKVDKEFWSQFGIKLTTLKAYNVFSIKYFLCNNKVYGIYSNINPMYAYKVFDKFKIYRPLASKYTKWRSNLTNYHIQGLVQIPNDGGNLLIITKSLKDVMVLREMGYDAIAASSETTFIPKDILESLKLKWKHILILYDRDKTGMKKARDYSRKYKLDAFFINKRFKAKDISDAVKLNGFDTIKDWLIKTLQKYDN